MSLLFRTTQPNRLPFRSDGRLNDRRIPFEFYPTPPEAVRALMSVESFSGSIWEPACGDGAIAKTLTKEFGAQVIATDVNNWGHGLAGVDFLEETDPRAKHIITNPPYGAGLGDAFAVRALHLTRATGGKVAFLLNITSLCHHKRTRWFVEHPPSRIWSIDNIVCWPAVEHGFGEAPRYFKNHRYVWVVWDPRHSGPTEFGWLSGADFKY